MFSIIACVLAYFRLEETLDRTKQVYPEPNYVNAPTTSSIEPSHTPGFVESNHAEAKRATLRTIISHPPLRIVVLSGFLISALATAYDVVFALMCFTPIHLGGLSLTVGEH
jgi:hypothetical protein